MRMRRDKTGDVVGRSSWRSSFLGRPGAKISLWKAGNRHKEIRGAKRKKGRWVLWGGNENFTSGTNGSAEARKPEGSRVSRCLGICYEFHHR